MQCIWQSVTSNSKQKSNKQPQTYYNIHTLMYNTSTCQHYNNQDSSDKTCQCQPWNNRVHSYEYSNISAKNGEPSSVIKPRLYWTVVNVYVLMYSKSPLIPCVRDQSGATLPNIPDYQTPLILIISIYQTLVRPALMYGTTRHICSNYMVQCRKKNGELGTTKNCASFTGPYQNN